MKHPTKSASVPTVRRRLVSMLYESLLLLGVVAVLVVPLMLYAAASGGLVSGAAQRVYFFVGLAAYFIWHWQGGHQTLAMRTWKLAIRNSQDQAPELWRLAIRYAFAWPSIGLFGIGLFWALFDRDRQFLHDRVAGTRVIYVPPTKS